MKLLLPVGTILFAAGVCCCGGDLEKVLEEAGLDVGGVPADGRVMFSVPGNERVRVVDLSSEDAYYTDKSTIVGITCTTDGPSTYNGDGWHGGSVKDCTNGTTYYFYKAAYVDMGPAPAPASLAIPGTRATRPLPSGGRVKILDVHSEDAYYADRATIIGKACRLDGESSFKDVEWHGGQVYCDDGSSYYFYKAAYEDLGGGAVPVATGMPPGAVTYSLPSGSRVTIADVAPDDAYYADRMTIIGKVCTLGEASSFKDGYWHGGSISCDDGSSYYFYKAAYLLSGAAPAVTVPPGALTYSLPNGTRVVIADIAADDAYFSSKSGMIGKRCTMGEQSILRDTYWHGGQVYCDDGSSYYFYKAALQAGG